MKSRITIGIFFLLLTAILLWRVEWDTAFRPARLHAAMGQRACAQQAPAAPETVPFGEPPPATPSLLYRQYCAACHGVQGDPPPFLTNSSGMPGIPRLRTTPQASESWSESITMGRGAMPAYAQLLSPEQIRSLLQYITSWEPHETAPAAPLSRQASPPGGTFRAQQTRPAVSWARALASFLLSIPLGVGMLRGLLPLCGAVASAKRFEYHLACTFLCAAVAWGSGALLWGHAAFVLPAAAIPAGLAWLALRRSDRVAAFYKPWQAVALAVACYAFIIPLLVDSYVPGQKIAPWQQAIHATCSALLILSAFLPHHLTSRTRPLHATAVLLVLAAEHALLASWIP